MHFYILNAEFIALTALFIFWLDKQSFGFRKCGVVCFDKCLLITIDKRRRDDTRLFVKCGPGIIK